MDEDKNTRKPLFAQPYREGDDELVPGTPQLSELLEEPPAPPAPVPQYQTPAAKIRLQEESSPVRTFQGDIAHTIKSQNTSVVQIALAEAKKRERTEEVAKENSAGSRKNIILIALSLVLFVAAVGVIGYLLWPSAAPSQASLPAASRPILLPDSTDTLPIDNLDRNGLISALQKAVGGNRQSLGSVSRIIPTVVQATGVQNADAQAFMKLLADDIPDTLLRSFDPQFYLGVHVFQKNEPYLVLRVDSYQSAFAGILAWEDRMPYDLADVFIAPSSRATTLNSRAGFRDEVVSNKDARGLVDSASLQTVLIYSFVDKNTLVITTNERTLQEIADRISKASLLK